MNLIAITREISPSINRCELSFHTREPIDVEKAIAQHRKYQDVLARLGARIICLPAEPDLPDSVFVEDAAIIVDEVAVITRMGAPSRRSETNSLVEPLSRYRSIEFLNEPATLDGGDVLRVGRHVFVGITKRTNREGVNQLEEILRPHGYAVEGVEVRNILHLKSACSWIRDDALLINRSFVDPDPFQGFELVEVPVGEPAAANVLPVNGVVIVPASFPKTQALMRERGYPVEAIDVSELQKAEAGVTCCSLIFSPAG